MSQREIEEREDERRKEKEKGRKRTGCLWVEDTRDSIYRSQSNEPLGVLIT